MGSLILMMLVMFLFYLGNLPNKENSRLFHHLWIKLVTENQEIIWLGFNILWIYM